MATENKYVIRLNNTVSYELNKGLIEGVETSYPYPSTSGRYANNFNDISFDENNDALELLPALLEVPEYYDGHFTSNHLITAIVKDRSDYVVVAPIWLSYKWCFSVYNGLPIYKDNIGTAYSVADFNADKLAGTLPEHLYVSAYNEKYETVYIPYPISASYNIFEVSDVASDTPPVIQLSEWSRYRNGTTLPYKPATIAANDNGKILSYDSASDSIKPTTKNLAEYDPNSVTEGDPLVFDEGLIKSTNELSLANLTVTDTATIAKSIVQETEQVTSTEDTIVLRENAVTPVPSRGSGVIINNYDGNGTPLGILADSDGTVRVGAEGGATVTYPVLWQVGSDYYNAGEQDMDTTAAVTPQGVYTSADASYESTDSIVSYNGSYYFKYIDWYVNPRVWLFAGNTVTISNGPPAQIVTDEDLIAILDTLTPVKVKYYVNAVFTTVGDKQPIATREEANVLNNNDLFAWDATANQLKHITRPTVNGTALKAIVTNGAVTGYDWGSSGGSGVSFIGTRAAYNTAKLIPEGQDGHIPAGSLVIITDEDELIIGEDA